MERDTQGHLLQGLVNIQLDLSDFCNDWVKRLMKREVSSRNYQESIITAPFNSDTKTFPFG